MCNKSTTIGRTVLLSDRFQYLGKRKMTKIQNINQDTYNGQLLDRDLHCLDEVLGVVDEDLDGTRQ